MKTRSRFSIGIIILLVTLVLGQVIAYVLSPDAYRVFIARLPGILSMVAFWAPIIAIIAGLFVWVMLRLVGFQSLEEVRVESVEQNNPTPAILLVGTLIASLLFLMLVIRP